VPPPQAQGYKLAFADEFDRFDISPNGRGVHTWYEGVWFNRQHAPRTNISAANSVLSLKWERGQAATDTSITTLSRDLRSYAAWRYGYFEARMRWDVVNGAWPAFWLIPVQDATGQDFYNGSKESGEIDIFEGQGDHPHTFYGTVHDWVNLRDHASRNNAFALPGNLDFSQFHVYGLLWTPGQVTWYLDNQPLHSETTPAIFDRQDFFLVLGMQEGEDWSAGSLSGVTAASMTLSVDWVRVWQQ
jgi:beta-glucanase (GH16 family)